ncbi:hypothetical protein EST92_22315 [Streptomyces sp. TM32]|uniref:hypothetical protein n=1 Tax=Streptomyces sp. TM32 TaxID=1652669 RepID=UPI001011B874|nr:hypothetical protein [Streptomyces sp. TM32]RXS73187.1 hypothetical protein EST92_22315 [Streptomyces sp. TM32]
MARPETGVAFHRTLLHRFSGGEFPVDAVLFARIDRTLDQLEEAAEERDAAARRVIATLEPIEAAARSAPVVGGRPIATADQAALLAIAGSSRARRSSRTSWRPRPRLLDTTEHLAGSYLDEPLMQCRT